MPFRSRRAPLQLTEEERQWLQHLSHSRAEPAGRVQRAHVLLSYHRWDILFKDTQSALSTIAEGLRKEIVEGKTEDFDYRKL